MTKQSSWVVECYSIHSTGRKLHNRRGLNMKTTRISANVRDT